MGLVDRFRASKSLRVIRGARSVAPETLAEAKRALRELGVGSLPGLLELLGEAPGRDPQTREAAIDVLGSLLDDGTLPQFLDALGHDDRTVQKAVAEVLAAGRSYDPRGLIPALSQPEIPNHRIEAVLRARADDFPVRVLVDILPDMLRESRSIIGRLLEERVGPATVPDLAPLADHSDWWIRHQMAHLLGLAGGEESTEPLVRLLRDPNKSVRLQAVKSLRSTRAVAAVPDLVAALRDTDLTVQAQAIDALIAIGDTSAVPHLVEILQDESEQTRRAAVEVLNAVATDEAIQDLVSALRDADWWVRVRAADALGTLGGEPVVAAIVGLLQDDDIHLRRYAVEILNTVPGERAVEPLIGALRDEDWWVRERSIDALGRIGDARAVEPLVDLLMLDPDCGPLCARALGALRDGRAIAPLLSLLESDAPDELRHEAEQAIGVLAKGEVPAEVRPRIEEMLKQQGRRVERTRLKPMAVRAGAAADPEAARRYSSASNRVPSEQRGEGWADSTVRAAPPVPYPARTRSSDSVHAANPAGPRRDSSDGGEPPRSTPSPTPAPRRFRPEDVEPGAVLLDRFEVREKIGRGGFATVFLAQDRTLGEEVILKILSPHLSSDERMALRFVQELKIARKISHPNVIRIHDLLEIDEARAITMEFFRGRDLGRILDEEQKLDPARAIHISLQVAAGLGAAHDAGVIHRDVKPGNILVGDGDEVKLLDFGLAAITHDAGPRLTRTGHLVGTPHYMAPELIRGDEIDGRADFYSFGVVLYEMLSGTIPIDGDNPMNILFRHLDGDAVPLGEVCPDLPAPLQDLVSRLMSVHPDGRPADARAFVAELEALGI